MAKIFYWNEDWEKYMGSGFTEDVYLLAPVSNASDKTDYSVTLEGGLKLSKSGLSLTAGGPDQKLSGDEWNIRQEYNGSKASRRTAISFTGDGTLFLTAKTGGSGTVARVVGGIAYSYDDNNIRISSDNLIRSSNHDYAEKESTWYLLDNSHIQYDYNYKYNLYNGVSTSGAVADSSTIYAGKTLTVGSSFNGYLQAEARNFSHGGWVKSGTVCNAYDTANSTSTVAIGLQGGTSVVFGSNFFGSMDVSARADLASFATRSVADNTVAAYAVYSPAGIEMKTGLWNGQLKASVHSSILDATKAWTYDTVDGGELVNGKVTSGTFNNVPKEVSGNGSLTGNLLQSTAVKSDGDICINKLDSNGNENRVVEQLRDIDYDVYVDNASVNVMIGGNTITSFSESDGKAEGVTWNRETNGGTVTFDYFGTASIGNLIGYLNGGGGKVRFEKITQVEGKQNTYTAVLDSEKMSSYTTEQILAMAGSASIELHDKADEMITYTATNSSYTRNDTISWTRTENGETILSRQTEGGVLFTYSSTAKGASDRAADDITVCISYDNDNLSFDDSTGVYTYHAPFGFLFNDGMIDYNFRVETGVDEEGDPQYTYKQSGNLVEYGTDVDQVYCSVRGHHDTGSGSYTLTWISDDDELAEGGTVSYKLDGRKKEVVFSGDDVSCESYAYRAPSQTSDGTAKTLYKYTVTITDPENLQSYADLGSDVVIYAEVKSNKLLVNDGTLKDNTVQAIGLDAADELTLNLLANTTTVLVEVCDNSMSGAGSSSGNQINAIGLKGSTVNLQDFFGTVRLVSRENTGSNSMKMVGVSADNLNGGSNLDGTIAFEVFNNVSSSQTYAGYYVTGNMKVAGALKTEIAIDARECSGTVYGYYVGSKLSASCYAGNFTVTGDMSGKKYGICAGKICSTNADLFVVGGTIAISGAASESYGILVGGQSVDLLVKGAITVEGGISKNYAINAGEYAYNDDRVELDAGATVIGDIELGGGKNTFIVNSSATFRGYVEHSIGTTNVTYRLSGEAKDDVVSTITSGRDASLTTGATLTLDCSNVKEGETYLLIQYEEGDARTEADKYWKNADITVTQNGFTSVFRLYDGVGTGSLGDTGLELNIQYDEGTGTLSATAVEQGDVGDCTIYAVGLTENGNVELDRDGAESLLANYRTLMGITAVPEGSLPSLDVVTGQDVLVSTVQDADTGIVSSSVTLNWMQYGTNSGAFDLTYGIYRQDGTLYAENTVRLDASDKKVKQETGTALDGYNLYAYTVSCVPEDCTVKWTVRDYMNSSVSKSTEACELSTTPVDRSNSLAATVDKLEENLSNFGNGSTHPWAVNPNDSSKGIDSAVVKFQWNKPTDSYVVDRYCLEFFDSINPLTKTEQEQVYAAYADGKKAWNGEYDVDCDVYGNGSWYFQFRSNGLVQIREASGSVYNFTAKDTTATEILASGLPSHGYVYWHVKAIAADVNPETEKAYEGDFVDGIAFQVTDNDTEGPDFESGVKLQASLGFSTDEKTGKLSKYILENIEWYQFRENQRNYTVRATDEKDGSGTYSYVLQYRKSGTAAWTNLVAWEESEIYNSTTGELDRGKLSDVELPSSGVYDLRVVARDLAGNEGSVATEAYTVYAQDTLAPLSVKVNSTATAEYKKNTTDLLGYSYSFTWDATTDAEADTKNLSTGLYDYTITWKYTTGSGETKYLEKYSVYGVKDGVQTVNALAVGTVYSDGKVQLTGEDLEYDSYVVKSDEVLAYMNENSELTGNQYSFSVTASDVAGNTTTLFSSSALDISTVPDISAPEGTFSQLSGSVTVTSRETVMSENTVTTTAEDGTTTTTTTYTEDTESKGKALSADVTFKWSDNYVDDSGVRYLLQFSDSAGYDSSRTYTFLITNSSESSVAEQLYSTLQNSGAYRNLRVAAVDSVTSKTVTFGNTYVTANSGLFSGMRNVYWHMKALDLKGNVCNDWGSDQSFTFTDSERSNETITDTASPAAATSLKISTDTYDSATRRYTGDVKLSYSTEASGFGVSYSIVTLTNTQTKEVIKQTVDHNSDGAKTSGILAQISSADNKLPDGNYVIRVTNCGAGGNTIGTESVTFLQDCTAPAAVKTISTSVLPGTVENNGSLNAYITWSAATDEGSGVDHYILRWSKHGTGNWTEETVTGNVYCKSLTKDTTYDFEVYAVDKKGNYSDKTVKSGTVAYSDIDASGDYVYSTGGAFTGEVIGLSDESDVIQVNMTGGNGLMEVTISNLFQLVGSGALEVSILNSQKTEVKKWKIAAGGAASTSAGQKLRYYYTGDDSDVGYIRIRSTSGSSTALQYALAYDFTAVATAEKDNTAYGSDHLVTVTVDNTGTLVEDNDGWPKDIRVGCGNADDYARLSLDYDGRYSFTLSRKDPEGGVSSLDTAKLTIYKTKAGSTKLTAVKTITMAASANAVCLADLLLDEGDYFIRVNAPKAASGANLVLTMDVAANPFTQQDNDDDAFGNLADGYRAYSLTCSASSGAIPLSNENTVIDQFKYESRKVAAAKTLSFEGHNFLRGGYDANGKLGYDWVGYGDVRDFTAFTVMQGGTYCFSLLKSVNLANFSVKTGSVTLTVYQLKEGKTSLSRIGSFVMKDQNNEVLYFDGTSSTDSSAVYTLSQLWMNLKEGTYYVCVNSDKASQGDSISYALVADACLFGDAPENGTVSEAAQVSISTNATFKLQGASQCIGLNGSTAWYNLTVHGSGNHSFKLIKSSASSSDATLTVTLYQSDKTGAKMSVVRSVTVAAADLGQTLTVENLAAGNYMIRVYAKDGSSGRNAWYTLEDTVSGLAAGTVLTTAGWFAGADRLGTFGDEETSKTVTADMAMQTAHYVCFDTGNWAGEFQLTSSQNGITAYILKDGATSLTKLSGNVVFLEAHTVCYVALANSGIGSTANLTVTRGLASRLVSDDNDWAELSEEHQLTLDSSTPGVSWSDAVGYGDLQSCRRLVLTSDGSYNFSLNQTSAAGISPAVTMTLYKWNKKGTGLSKVKSLNAGSGLGGVLLEAGEYYLVVKGNKTNGYAGYEAAVTAVFQAPEEKNSNNTPSTAEQISVKAGNFDAISGWVGYKDEYDYYQLNPDDFSTGTYTFQFSLSDLSNLTVYAVSASDSSLKAIYKYDCKVPGKTESMDLKLRSEVTYVVAVKSTTASKGGSCSFSFSAAAFRAAYTITAVPLNDPNQRLRNLSSIGNSSAQFTITENTKGTYNFDLGYGHSVLKYNAKNGQYTAVKLNKHGQANLSAGTYLIDGMDASKNCEIVFDTAQKIVTSAETDQVTNISVKNVTSGTPVAQKYCFLQMEDGTTADYSFSINSAYSGTMYLYVRDANVPDCGMRQLASYDLTAGTKYTTGELLLSEKSEYLLEFVSSTSDGAASYVLNRETASKTMKQLTGDGQTTDSNDAYFDVTEETAGKYTVNLCEGMKLNSYDAATGAETTLFTASSEKGGALSTQLYFEEGEEYLIRDAASSSLQHLFTLDAASKYLTVTEKK